MTTQSNTTTLAITGASGRMGMRLVALAHADKALKVVAALGKAGGAKLNRDAGEIAGVGSIGVPIAAELTSQTRSLPQVMIDFSQPEAVPHWIGVCREKKIALVIGTTGLKENEQALIDAAAKDIAILQAPNMSLGVNLLFKIAAQVAKTLGDDYDIEIVEAHHRLKKEAPSGTADGLAAAILKSTGKTKSSVIHGRHGDDALRKRGEIGMHSLRLGDEVGKHSATFATVGERIELSHAASSRDTFALGALRAAKWIADKPAGRYTMNNVLGLD